MPSGHFVSACQHAPASGFRLSALQHFSLLAYGTRLSDGEAWLLSLAVKILERKVVAGAIGVYVPSLIKVGMVMVRGGDDGRLTKVLALPYTGDVPLMGDDDEELPARPDSDVPPSLLLP